MVWIYANTLRSSTSNDFTDAEDIFMWVPVYNVRNVPRYFMFLLGLKSPNVASFLPIEPLPPHV